MIREACGVAIMAAGLATGSPAIAGESITGRWAASPSACQGIGDMPGQSLVVTTSAVRWLTDSCRIARVYKAGDTVHLQAVCPGAGGERSVPVRLRPSSDRLLVQWDRSPAAELRRCR